jgi:hypothetical protein
MRQLVSALRLSCGLTSRERLVILVSAGVAVFASAVLSCFFPAYQSKLSHEMMLRGPFRKLNNSYSYAAIFNRPEFRADAESYQSTLLLYENGKPIGPAHAKLDDIAHKGNGRYSYSADKQFTLIFSTSENDDPNTSGKIYTISDPNARDPNEKNLR